MDAYSEIGAWQSGHQTIRTESVVIDRPRHRLILYQRDDGAIATLEVGGKKPATVKFEPRGADFNQVYARLRNLFSKQGGRHAPPRS